MIRQQPEVHNTFASGDSCFCVAKVAPVVLSTITASVDWLSDKRYLCVRINHQIGPLSRTEQKSLWPQAVFRKNTDITTFIYNIWRDRQLDKSEFIRGRKKYEKNFIKVLTEVQNCCNIYIVVAEIQQSKALELNACRGCFERSDKKIFQKVLDKRNWMRYYIKDDSHRELTKIW